MTAPPVTDAATPADRELSMHLGTIGDVRVQVAIDAAPWRLPIDMLAISVGPRGLGELGHALARAVPGIDLNAADLTAVTPDEPGLVPVRERMPAGDPLRLRLLALASARDADQRSSVAPEPPASLDAVRRATAAVIDRALSTGAASLGLPLLGAGAIGFPVADVAFEVVPVVRAALHGLGGASAPPASLSDLTFVCRDRPTSRAIARVWGYHDMLTGARAEALADDVVRAGAARAELSPAQLEAVLDLPEEEIWRPCLIELTQLRHIDRELDDIRTTLVGALENEHDALLQGAPTAPDQGPRRHSPSSQKRLDLLELKIEDSLDRDHRWRQLTKQREQALATLHAALLQESFLPRLRETINKHLDADRRKSRKTRRAEFRRRLERVDTSGLRAEPKPGGLVRTAAHEQLMALTDPSRFPRASIGVAGPRGCGKSTLLREITLTWKARTDHTDALSIFVPAPASYASRDFLVHLYSAVCQAVLDSDPELRIRVGAGNPPPVRLRSTSLLYLVLAPALVLVAGIGAFAASTVWTAGSPAGLRAAGVALVVAVAVPSALHLVTVRLRSARRLPSPSRLLGTAGLGGLVVVTASTGLVTGRRAAGLGLIVVAVATVMRIERGRAWDAAPAAASSQPPPASSSIAPATQVTGEHEPLDGDLRASAHRAAVLAVAAAQGTALVAGAALFVLDAGAAPVDAWLVLGAVLTAAASAALVPGLRWHAALVHHLEARGAPPGDPRSYQARQHLDKMRYQRSVSSGWTSTVKLAGSRLMPLGIEAGATGATTEADVPLSVPEIVAGITTLLSARGPAVLAIDELDKIESVDEARKFLNEIKGIFEAKDTRLLVSMSEDAIARFERRGLPFRDVFDSAFDEVVRVPHLSAAQARSLLDQRVTGVPEPLLALAFCQSGGLPRDLLRAAQQLIEIAPAGGGGGTVPDIVREAVHADVAAKIAAVTAAMRSIAVEPDVSSLIRWVQAVDVCRPGGPRGTTCLLDDGWLAALSELGPVAAAPQADDAADRRELLRLGVELVGYLYYCRTLLELFCIETDTHVDRLIRLVDDDGGRGLDDMARTRQNFAVNPFVAWRQLDDVRQGAGFPACSLPAPFVVAARGAAASAPVGGSA